MVMSCEVIKQVKIVKNSVKSPKPDPWRLSSVNREGEWGRQGDIYVELIAKPEVDLVPAEKFTGQVAIGSSRGSRHCVNPLHVTAFVNPDKDISAGPILFIREDTEITHPEHGSVNLERGIWVRIFYQVNEFDKVRSRVID